MGMVRVTPVPASKHDLTPHDSVVPVADQHAPFADLLDGHMTSEYDSDDEEI